MPISGPLTDVYRLVWQLRSDSGEVIDMSLHTGAIGQGETTFEDYTTCMEHIFSAAWGTAFFPQYRLERVTVQLWDGNRWQQAISKLVEVATAPAGDILPPQCAVVITLKNTSQWADIPSKRRHNRLYWGPIQASRLQANGRLNSTAQLAYANAMKDTHQMLIDDAPANIGPPGICVVSVAAGGWMEADLIEVGDVVDTQRRRRNALVEARLALDPNGA